MSDEPTETVYGRPAASVKAAALRALADADDGWNMDAFLVACLVALGTKPADMLKFVGPHRVAKRPVGRPRKPPTDPERP